LTFTYATASSSGQDVGSVARGGGSAELRASGEAPSVPARRAVWQRYLGAANCGVDVDRLVTASELFTPADIEFAARKGAQAAFEREMRDGGGRPATTEDYLTAIGEVRPTLTADMLAEFERGKSDFARL
jgi:SpoVK/Ycf46/Vps4 family AAA+-type ATPase